MRSLDYSGPVAADAGPLEREAFGLAGDFAVPAAARDAATALATGTALDPARREAAIEAATVPALRTFREDIIPAIARKFASSGNRLSGTFMRALGRAGSDFASNLASVRADAYLQDERLRMEGMPYGIAALTGLETLPIQVKAAAGAQERGIRQAEILGRFALRDQQLADKFGSAGALASLKAADAASSGSGGGGFSPGGFGMGALSGAVAGAPLGPWGIAGGALIGGVFGSGLIN